MKFNIDSSKLTNAPYSADLAEAFLFDDTEELHQLLLELQNARPGSYLISGYRGSGKTSFVNRVTEKINGFVVIELNIAKSISYPILLKRIIRELYLKYISRYIENPDDEFHIEIKMLYDRTFNDIVHSQGVKINDEEKSELKIEYQLKKLLPYVLMTLSATGIAIDLSSKWVQYIVLICSAIWAYVSTFTKIKTGSRTEVSNVELSRKSLYDDEIAEHHLFAILQKLKNKNVKLLIIFDELDKLQDNDKIKDVINDLKPLLLSGYASFMVVAGQSLYYDLEKSIYLDDLVISTLFSKTVHVSFLKNVTLKKFCLALISDDAIKSDQLVNDYFDNIILQSGRIPRKLVNLIRSTIVWDNQQATVIINDDQKDTLRWKSRILQAVTYAIDNELAGQARNNVQLDFFTAQLFLWLGKMLQYTSIRFKRSDIFNIGDYSDHYPATYKAELNEIWNTLIDALFDGKLIKIHDGDEDEETSYTWILTAEQASDDDKPNLGGNGAVQEAVSLPNTEDDEISDDTIKQSQFLTDFAELEGYIRQLYFELVPNTPNARLSFRQLIDKFTELGVFNESWRNSLNIKQLSETRNKIAHGVAIGFEDLDQVRSSIINLNRFRAEINEAYAYYVISKYLRDIVEIEKRKFISIEKTTKGGFDILATAENYTIAFEIKSSSKGKLDSRMINELLGKFSNYVTINRQILNYVLFYFMPTGTKSIDDFFMNFNELLKSNLPDHQNDIYLFYLTTANSQSIRSQIEKALDGIIQKNQNPSTKQPLIEKAEIKYLTWGDGKWKASFKEISLKWGLNVIGEFIDFTPSKLITHTPIQGKSHDDDVIHYISDLNEEWEAKCHCKLINGEYQFVFETFPHLAESLKKESQSIRFTDWDGIKWEASISHPNINNKLESVRLKFLCKQI